MFLGEGMGSPYPGPVGSVVSPALFGQLEFGHLARASSLCGACREACPVDIDLPKLLLRVRAGVQTDQRKLKPKPNAPAALAAGLEIFTMAAGSSWRFEVAQRLAGLFGSLVTLFSKGDPWMRLPKFSGWGYSKDFPRPATRSFRSRFRKRVPASHEADALPIVFEETNIANPSTDTSVTTNPVKRIDKFAAELEALGGNFTSCTLGEVVDKILEILSSRNINQLLVWDEPYLPGGILEKLSEAGIQIIHPAKENQAASSLVKAGLTGATAGIADTGSLLLLGGNGRPLTASLLPELHIAVLQEKDVFENLLQALHHVDVRQAPAAILITGPSRTADIEMTLTIGVHGPGDLYVVCIKSE